MRPRPAPADTVRRTGFPVVSPTKDLRDSKLPSHFQIGRFAGVSRRRGHGDYLQLDETPVKVIDPDLLGRTATGWLWAYARPGGPVPFDFQGGRGREGPEVLARPRGRLEELEPGKPMSPVLLKGPLGMAIRYTLGPWDASARYQEDGRFEIDNNLVENAIRPRAVGKKNGLFIGHPEAGWRSAVIDSLLITARRAGLDPAKWLEDVLRMIPTATTANMHEILPGNGKPATA